MQRNATRGRWWICCVCLCGLALAEARAEDATPELAALPRGLTSFGGAESDGTWFVYGGHDGAAHSYSIDQQSPSLYRYRPGQDEAWQEISTGPRLQAHDGDLIRIGGFEARNAEGEADDLWSIDSVARFDIAKGQWSELARLPEPRSSFDAAVLDDQVFVIGGWALQGDGETQWHGTAYRMDLSAADPQWKPLPTPPFQRRALAVAAYQGRIYAIGGMNKEGGPSTAVDVYDPKADKWTSGPELPGKPMGGFGCAAIEADGRLVVTTSLGDIWRLTPDDSQWESIGQYEPGRFFHRMYRHGDGVALVGGANMETGRFTETGWLKLPELVAR